MELVIPDAEPLRYSRRGQDTCVECEREDAESVCYATRWGQDAGLECWVEDAESVYERGWSVRLECGLGRCYAEAT